MSADARREVIEAAATEVFAERGYHGASIDEIARRSGVSAPVVYDHFASKQDLHRRLLERHTDDLLDLWREHLPGDAPAAERSRARSPPGPYVETHPFAWQMLFRDSSATPRCRRDRRLRARGRAALVQILGAEPGAHGLAGAQDAAAFEMAVELIRSGLTGLAVWWREHPQVPREHVVATAMNVLWIGFERVSAGDAGGREPLHRGQRPGTAEVVALGVGAAELAQRLELRLGLDALRHERQAEAVGERDDAADERAVRARDAIAATNDRSTLSMSIGRSASVESDENPVPKSSIAIRTPSSRSAENASRASSTSSISADSVSSSTSRRAARPECSSAAATRPTKSSVRSCTAETLTATVRSPSGATSAHARSSTQVPSGTIRPEASAIGMKSSGAIGSPSGVRQRSSASTPSVAPVASATTGW